MLAAPFRCHAPLASVQVRLTAQPGRIHFLTNVVFVQCQKRCIYACLEGVHEALCELCINCFGGFDGVRPLQIAMNLSNFYQFRQYVQK